jgi:hypothetical protein
MEIFTALVQILHDVFWMGFWYGLFVNHGRRIEERKQGTNECGCKLQVLSARTNERVQETPSEFRE